MKKLFVFIAILALAACSSGSGKKIGSIVKLQQVGVFCKTWEGESIRGGYSGGSGVVGGVFHFTIEDPTVLTQVQNAMEAQQEIELSYRKEGFTFCRSENEGNFFATNVRVIDRPTTTIDTQVNGTVAVAPATVEQIQTNSNSTQNADIKQLLQVQAELIKKLAQK
jgi:hypothetical protein